MSEKNDDILKSENHTPNDSMDMEYSEDDRKYDDNSSLDGNPPSIVSFYYAGKYMSRILIGDEIALILFDIFNTGVRSLWKHN